MKIDMESGYYVETQVYAKNESPFWFIGYLPDGELLVLKPKSDGTTYTERVSIDDAKYWRRAGE